VSPLGALLWAKRRIARHTLASVRHESKLKVVVVSSFAAALWLGIFFGARWGFGLFETFGAELLGEGRLSLGDLVTARLLAIFALALWVMLIFSNVLIAYSTLYRSREVPYLVQSPISTSSFFLGRFAECVSFSSWASAYLGSALLLAYGLETEAPWGYYAALPAFYLPFVILPAAMGAILAILGVRLLVRLERRHVMVAGIVLGGVVFGTFRERLRMPDLSDAGSLQALVEILGRAQSPFLPSSWLAQGVLAAATGEIGEALFQLLLLGANALLATWVAVEVANGFFYRGWADLAGAAEGRPRGGVRGIWAWLDRLLAPLPAPLRVLVSKDVKLFWRDPAQWSQFVLFFGVMGLYVANLSGAREAAAQPIWRGWVGLLNTGAAMLILATLTTRFVYPLVSLEGQRLWILGLAPISLRGVVWQKFWLSAATTAVFSVGLALFSARALGLGAAEFWISVVAVAAATLALSGLSVGLGSLYPNFDEDNPARIVSGLGGTLNFVLSLVYVIAVVAAEAVIFHWPRLEPHLPAGSFAWAVSAVLGWIVLLTLLAWLLPMALGLRHLERIEI